MTSKPFSLVTSSPRSLFPAKLEFGNLELQKFTFVLLNLSICLMLEGELQ